MFSLRPHQQHCLDAILTSYAEGQRVISFQMATGSGKTRVLLVSPSSMKHTRVIYVFPTLGLIRQFKDDYLDEFTNIFPKYVEASSDSSTTETTLTKKLSRKSYCVITTYASLPKVLQLATSIDCVLFDEAHHADAPECQKCMSENESKVGCVIRASATLNETDAPCFTYPFHQAVKDGVCRDYSTYCFIKKKGSEHELISYLEAHRKQTGNSKVMVFTTYTEAEKEGSTNVIQFMAGYRESVEKLGGWIQGIDSSQSQNERQHILKTFEENKEDRLSLLVSCRTIGEGVDTKKANVVLFVDPIRSSVMIIQRIGRGTRVYRDENGNPRHDQRDGSVIVGMYIDPCKYEGKTEEEIDQLLKENMSEKGDFSPIFCVLAALRASDPDTYYQCIHFFDRKKVKNEQGLYRVEVPRDGNCFFHCVALQTGETHSEIRQRVVDYMEEHPEKYEEFLSDEDHVNSLREEGEWNHDAMDVVVRATADMLGQTIRVHRDGRIDEIGDYKQQMDVLLEGNHYTYLTNQDENESESESESEEDDSHDESESEEDDSEDEDESKKQTKPKKKLFIDIDPEFKIIWKVSGDLTEDFTARIYAEIENDGMTLEDRWKLKHQEMCSFIKNSHIDLTKRKRPSESSKIKDEKRIVVWISNQKKKYDKTGPKQSLEGMKNQEIWNIWTDTLNDPEYKYALQDLDLVGDWKLKHQEMCSFIKSSNIDPTKRKCPSSHSKNGDEKRIGQWISDQKKKYDKNGPEHSLACMKNIDIWNIWTETLNDPEYNYALQDYTENWKLNYQEMCSFIKSSDKDPTKRKYPPSTTKNSDEKRMSKWISHQKENYKTSSEQSFYGMKNQEIWNIWTDTLNDPEYKYALQDLIGNWKLNHQDMCSFIKNSHIDPKKRKCPSTTSKNSDEKRIGSWISDQKKKYDKNGPEESLHGMKNIDIWNIWNNTLNDPEYKYALQDSMDDWKLNHQDICSFIKNSHIDPTKRKCPSATSKNSDEKRMGQWISQKKNKYDENGPEQSLDCMKNQDIWNIWTNTLNDPEYKYALQDLMDDWKLKHQEACFFIKSSNKDPKKRKRPSKKSKNGDEKRIGEWVYKQNQNYKTTPEQSLYGMKNQDKWNIWTDTLNDPEYKYAFKNSTRLTLSPTLSPTSLTLPASTQPKQENNCTSILKSGDNKGKACGKKNCGVHNKQVQKPMTLYLPQPQSIISVSEPRAPRPQSQLSLLHKEYKTLRSDNLATKFREQPQLWHEYHRISDANEATFPDGQVPYQRVISFLNTHLATFHPKKQKTIVDMGCGTARVQQAFANRPNLTFHNLDHISCDERVTVADISHTGLEDGDADVVILCLAMWGSNKEEYISEAFRLLDPNGRLIIVEPSKRWMDETGHRLREMLIRHGFVIVQEEVMDGDQVHKFSLFVVKK